MSQIIEQINEGIKKLTNSLKKSPIIDKSSDNIPSHLHISIFSKIPKL